MGEPHTQEHLFLGKGNKGRALGSQEPMSLVSSSANATLLSDAKLGHYTGWHVNSMWVMSSMTAFLSSLAKVTSVLHRTW